MAYCLTQADKICFLYFVFEVWDVLSLGHFVLVTFCPWGSFVLGTFCPCDIMSEDVLSWDVLSWDVLSWDVLPLGTFCLFTRKIVKRDSVMRKIN